LRSGRVRYGFLPILRLCSSLRPHWVVSTVGHLNLLLLLLKPFLPRLSRVVVREANTPSIRLRYTRIPRLYHLSYRLLYPLCDSLVCNCESMKEDLVEHFSIRRDRISVIPNPVDRKRIHRQMLAEPNPYSGNKVQIVFVGRLNYQKGVDLALKAFRRCHRRILNTHLTIVGDGPEESFLRSLTEYEGISEAVSFAGRKENPFPYMFHADFLVLPSRWEGSPNTALESLGCGTPVLAFDCPGGTGEIIEHGENGWLVPPGDWEGLAEQMIRIVEGKGWAGLKGKDLLPESYLCESVASRWEALFLGLPALKEKASSVGPRV
jgi:glycosyltransferase involved in cell wall biosynthesis